MDDMLIPCIMMVQLNFDLIHGTTVVILEAKVVYILGNTADA